MSDLIKRLTEGDSYSHRYPVTPEEAADMIVSELLADISAERQAQVRNAIKKWGSEWGSSVASTAMESSYR